MNTCTRCGRNRHLRDLAVAAGDFYCHGDLDDTPTCFQTVTLGGDDAARRYTRR